MAKLKQNFQKIEDSRLKGSKLVIFAQNPTKEHGPATASSFKDTGVTLVALSFNEIGSYAPATASAFKNTGVTSGALSGNKIMEHAPQTAANFKNTGVETVDMRDNDISEIDSRKCMEIFYHLGINRVGIDHSSTVGVLFNQEIRNQFIKGGGGEDIFEIFNEQWLNNIIGDFLVLDFIE